MCRLCSIHCFESFRCFFFLHYFHFLCWLQLCSWLLSVTCFKNRTPSTPGCSLTTSTQVPALIFQIPAVVLLLWVSSCGHLEWHWLQKLVVETWLWREGFIENHPVVQTRCFTNRQGWLQLLTLNKHGHKHNSSNTRVKAHINSEFKEL